MTAMICQPGWQLLISDLACMALGSIPGAVLAFVVAQRMYRPRRRREVMVEEYVPRSELRG
jgi:hypothetical protein